VVRAPARRAGSAFCGGFPLSALYRYAFATTSCAGGRTPLLSRARAAAGSTHEMAENTLAVHDHVSPGCASSPRGRVLRDAPPQTYHASIRTTNVSILALTPAERFRSCAYRPALEAFSWNCRRAGRCGERAIDSCRRELLEETGCRRGPFIPGETCPHGPAQQPDSSFFVETGAACRFRAEPGLSVKLVSRRTLHD